MKKLFALFFSVIAISASSVNKSNPKTTHPVKQQESLVDKACRLNNEVGDMILGYTQLIYDGQKLNSDTKELIPELDEAIRKIDNGGITYWNEELWGLSDRIRDIHDRSESIRNKHKKLKHRRTVVECQLEENPKLKNLVHMNGLYEVIGEWNAVVKVDYQRGFLYNEKVDELDEKTRNLSYFQNQEDLE